MTPNKCIEHVDSVKPNAYGEEDKLHCLNDVDGMVRRLVMQETDFAPYQYPDDMDTELLIPPPWDNLYALYVEAMIDYHNREYGNYNNAAAVFEARFDDYKKAYIREHMPKSAGSFRL